MPIRRETIGEQLKRIQKSRKKRDPITGMLYNVRADLTKRRQKITLVGLFVSDEKTFLIRPHVFETDKRGRNAREWDAWLAQHYGGILRNTILPGMADRTDKFWRLYRIVGWLGNDRAGLVRTKISKRRNKTKSSRR